MNNFDLTTMLGNISQSLYPIQRLVSGGAYLLGILFLMKAIGKLKKIGDYKAQSPSHERMYGPLIFMLMGALLIYLPTGLKVMANTAFGVGNIMSYSNYSQFNIYDVIGLLVRTAGVIWFVRGCVLISHASDPGTKEGSKGLLFLFAGVLAINFDNTIAITNYLVNKLVTWSLVIKTSQGF